MITKKSKFNEINKSYVASTDWLSINIKRIREKIILLTQNFWVSQLERLASLREKGLLTEEEYVEAKRKLIFKWLVFIYKIIISNCQYYQYNY